jgi:peptide/nickel transport system substrate-binding protein
MTGEHAISFGMSRRAFLARTALVVGGMGVGAFASACAPAASPAPGATAAPPKPTTAAAGAPATAPASGAKPSVGSPRPGGTLTWGQWDRNDILDPATASGASALEAIGQVLDSLVALDPDQTIYPALATRWLVEDDSKKYTFTLRDDVKFHDGSTLDSMTVKRNWERILDPATKAAGVVSLFGPIDKIDALDPRTLVATFKEPFPLFLQSVWRPYFGVMSAKALDALKPGEQVQTLVGSGPFKHTGRSPDGAVMLEANPDYAWGSEILKNRKTPYVQSIRLRTIAEDATRVATLESGESLVIDELSEPDYNRLKADTRFKFIEAPRRGLALGFFINVDRPPTDDPAVRQAMNYAVDRKSIVERLFFGVHKPTVGPLAEGVWGHWEAAEQLYGFDAKKAAQTLDDAGWKQGAGGIREKNGQKLSVVLATFRSPWTELAEIVQSQYRAIGIELQVQKMERGPYLDFTRAYQHNLCASAGTNIDPDELRQRYHSKNRPASNFANVHDDQLDALLTKGAQQPLNSDERRQTYEAAQRRLMDVLPFVSVMSQVRVEAVSARVNDLRMGADGLNALPLNDVWLDS